MPHVEYEEFRYDLGPSDQRGVTKKFSSLKRDLRDILGRGVPGLSKESVDGRVVASFLVHYVRHQKHSQYSITTTDAISLRSIPEYIK